VAGGRRLDLLGNLEKVARQEPRVGTERCALEVPRVLELGIRGECQKHHDHPVPLNNLRHGRDDQVCGVPHQNVDLVDVNELGIDSGNGRGIRLVIVVEELDRTAKQSTLGVNLLRPDLFRKKMRLAGRGKAAGQRHAEADFDGFLGCGWYCRGPRAERCGCERDQKLTPESASGTKLCNTHGALLISRFFDHLGSRCYLRRMGGSTHVSPSASVSIEFAAGRRINRMGLAMPLVFHAMSRRLDGGARFWARPGADNSGDCRVMRHVSW
jgi:hypothetical protein